MTLDAEIANLYWAAREAWVRGHERTALVHYRTLRAEHSIELYPEVALCNPTRFVHPLGTVLGRATYAPHLVVYQGVSVGSTVDHERPTFTGPCVLFPHSGVIGPVTVGKNVWITAGTLISAAPGKPWVIPDDVVLFRDDSFYGVGYKPTTRSVIDTFFSPTS